ncbi:cupin domain-containing protein [Nocardia pseudobrasiliensis]|uniref:Cupin domain n=1 Tax=Nocardia pseudobrasiliensis TaxID=45979 RepID=A0A370I880_9NOCA|nr:cupin domain-containing protein [Nocardia pseudobrasiliensis]RDI66937.1 cupin domain [Nocardia pseudobrasiliensis]
MSINVVPPGGGETLDQGRGIRVRILEDGTHTQRRLGLALIQLAPGSPGVSAHVHRRHEETFFVLSGAVRFGTGSDTLTAAPGTLITVPIGTPHSFANPDADAEASFLFTTTPDLFIGYFRDMADLGPDDQTPQAVAEIMANYATDPYHPGHTLNNPHGRTR